MKLFQQYIDEVFETKFPRGLTKVSEIHSYYVAFCNRHGEKNLSLTSFSKELVKKGFKRIKKMTGVIMTLKWKVVEALLKLMRILNFKKYEFCLPPYLIFRR